MSNETYVFGNLGQGLKAYPDDYTREIFEQFCARATAETQIIIHRDNNLIYYGYLRQLARSGQFLGFCIMLNDGYFPTPKFIFDDFEQIFSDAVARGEIVELAEQGEIVGVPAELSEKEEEVARIRRDLALIIENNEHQLSRLPPVRYDIDNSEVARFSIDDEDAVIGESSTCYSYTYIFKDDDFNTSFLNSAIVKIQRLSAALTAEIETNKALMDQLAQERRRRKQYRFVIALAVLALIVGVGLALQTDKLNNANDNIQFLNNTVDELTNDKSQLQEKLSRTQDALDRANALISSKNSEISNLEVELLQKETQINQLQSQLDYWLQPY